MPVLSPQTIQPVKEGEDSDSEQTSFSFNTITFNLDKVMEYNAENMPEVTGYETNVPIKVNSQRIRVQVDSGADVNIMGTDTFDKLSPCARLKPSNAK